MALQRNPEDRWFWSGLYIALVGFAVALAGIFGLIFNGPIWWKYVSFVGDGIMVLGCICIVVATVIIDRRVRDLLR